MIYGYARVSTDGQSVAALTEAGAAKVFRETASGAQTDRAQLRKALAALDVGDVLMVTRLDRLARSTHGPAEHSCFDYRPQGRFQILGRHMGRHHHPARAVDADRSRRARRVRARPDPRPHLRRPRPRQSAGQASWPTVQADRAPAQGSPRAAGTGRASDGHRAILQRESQHDFTIGRMRKR